jgi:ABC-type glycerol-3-phosphate transport system permease component
MITDKSNFKKIFFYFLLLVGFVISIFPIVWMIASSFKELSEIASYPPSIWPEGFRFENYIELFTEVPYAKNLFNSAFVGVAHTFIAVMVATLSGFALSKYPNAPGRSFFFIFIIATMMIPQQVLAIPLYILMGKIGWVNSYQALILPFVAQGLGVFLFKQYMDGVPDDLLAAARIDGCSEFGIFWRIILPIAKPALGAIGTIYFMNNWNFFFWPLIITNQEKMFTIPVALSQLQGQQYGVPYHLLMAGSVVATLPLIVIFLFFQRYFIRGITMGALKQ